MEKKGLHSKLLAWGRKKISLSAFADAQDIYHELLFQFPKLSHAGGFELLRSPEGGGKQLDIIAAPDSGYSVSYLRAVVHHAKIYIKPMQRDLSLEPVKEEVSALLSLNTNSKDFSFQVYTDPPKESCLNCGTQVTLTESTWLCVSTGRYSVILFC